MDAYAQDEGGGTIAGSDGFATALSAVRKRIAMLGRNSLLIVLFLLAWEIAPRVGLVDPVFIPPFSQVVEAFIKLTLTGELIRNTVISSERALTGFIVSSLVAIPLGFLVGWFKQFDNYVNPVIEIVRQLPVLALFPIFILFFGIDEVSKVVMIAVACFQAVFLNMVTGVKNIDLLLISSAQSLNYSNSDMFFKVVLPAATPTIFTGLRFGATVSILLLVAVEMMGAQTGLGYAINNYEVLFQVPSMYADILVLILMGLVANFVLVWIERRVSPWREEV
jgi:NitT/TauT family transport system permease protein